MSIKIKSNFNLRYRITLITLVSVFLVACGGSDSKNQFRLNENTVQFSALESDETLSSKSVSGSVSGVNDTVYFFIDLSNSEIIEYADVSTRGESGILSLMPISPSKLAVGNYSEIVEISVCFDVNCQSHLSGSPANITVTYDITADPLLFDTDKDGIPDLSDDFPNNANESLDTDKDGLGDNEDPDADNDGVLDEDDALPLDATEFLDADLDGIGDKADTDDDNDGVSDSEDIFPFNSSEWNDFDKDGLGDNADADDDNDTHLDDVDVFPFNQLEWKDNDGDGEGDNADLNDDNDSLDDLDDPFPFDSTAPGRLVSVSSNVAITNTESRFTLIGDKMSEKDHFYVNGRQVTVNILSSTLVELVTTPTESGEMEISIRHEDVSYQSNVLISVIDPVYFPYSIINHGGEVSKAYYDATRQAVYYQNSTSSELTQLHYVTGGGWEITSSKPIADLRSFSLNHNNNLLVAITNSELVEIEMNDLSIVNSNNITADWSSIFDANTILKDGEFDLFGRLTIVTKGSFSSLFSVDMDTYESERVTYLNDSAIASSSDGRFILLNDGIVSDGLFDNVPQRFNYYNASIDAIGERIFINDINLYDREFNTIAKLNSFESITDSDLSQDGSFIIGVDLKGGLHYFDVSNSRNELVSPLYSITLGADIGKVNKIIISDDQLTVFVFGDKKIAVIPMWQLIENVLGSNDVCPALGCGDIKVAEGVNLPGSKIVIPPVDFEASPAFHVSPVYAGIGETIEVLITGSGFLPASVVQFDDVLADNIRYINDEVMTANIPASLAKGDYIVTVDGHQGDAPTFSIIEQQNINNHYWGASGDYQELLYIAEKNILIAADSANDKLVRINLNDNSIITESVINLSDVTWCQEDGNLYTITDNVISQYDTDTLKFIEEVIFLNVNRLECVAENKLLLTSNEQITVTFLFDVSLLNENEYNGSRSFFTSEEEWSPFFFLVTDNHELLGYLHFISLLASSQTIDGVSRKGDIVVFGGKQFVFEGNNSNNSNNSNQNYQIFSPYNLSESFTLGNNNYITSSWSAAGHIGIINNVTIVNNSLTELNDISDLELGSPSASVITPSGENVYLVVDTTIYRLSISNSGLSIIKSSEILENIGSVHRVTTSLDGNTVFAAGENGIIAVNM